MVRVGETLFRARLAAGLGLLAIVIAYALLDRPVANLVHGLHRPEWCVWLTWIADVPVPLSVVVLIGGGIARLAGWRPGPAGRTLLAICITTLAATACKDVLKHAAGRTWPETWTNNNPSWIGNHVFGFHPFHGGGGYASFPSGHTTVIAASCAAAWRHLPRLWPIWASLPLLVIIGLLGADFHFLSDCLAGLLLGTAIAHSIR